MIILIKGANMIRINQNVQEGFAGFEDWRAFVQKGSQNKTPVVAGVF